MAILTRDQILSADDSPREPVDVPEWGGAVFVRVMSGAARDAWEKRVIDTPADNVRAALAVATVCDAAGDPLFTAADVAALGRKSAAALQRVFDVAMRINRVGKGDVEELAKNS